MDEDLKIVLTSELEADEEASAQRISAQLPNIAKLINSKSSIKVGVTLDEAGIQSQTQRITQQIARATKSQSVGASLSLDQSSVNKIKTELNNLKVSPDISRAMTDQLDQMGVQIDRITGRWEAVNGEEERMLNLTIQGTDQMQRTVTYLQTYNAETGEINTHLTNVTANLERQRREQEQVAAQAKKDNESRVSYLNRQKALLADIQAAYVGQTSVKPITDSAHLTALNDTYAAVNAQIETMIAAEGRLDNVQRSNLEAQISGLQRLVKEYQNAEYVATKLRTKDIGSIKADQLSGLEALEKRLESAGTLTDTFKSKIDGLKKTLQGVGTKDQLVAFLNSFDQLNNDVAVFQERLRGANKIYTQLISLDKQITSVQSSMTKLNTSDDKNKLLALQGQLSVLNNQRAALEAQLVPYADIIQYAKQATALEQSRLLNGTQLVYTQMELADKARDYDVAMQSIPSTIADLQTKFSQVVAPTENLVQNMRLLRETAAQYGADMGDREKVTTYERLQSLIGACSKEMSELLRVQRGDVNDFKFTQNLEKAKADLETVGRTWSALKQDPGLNAQFQQLSENLKRVDNQMDLRKWTAQFSTFKSEVKAAGKNMQSLGDILKNNVGKVLQWVSATTLLFRAFRLLRSALTTIVDLDTAMIDLQKVTTATREEYDRFYHSANGTAKALGVTTEEVISQTAEWARLGYAMQDAAKLAENSAIFEAISPDMDITQATDGLVSIIKAYDLDVEDSLDGIISKVNEVGNKFAVSNGDIVEAMTRSSAAMAAANNTFEETVALATAAIEITRDAATVGNGLKTLSMRIRGYDEETEEYSADVSELTGTIADLTKVASNNNRGISLFEADDPETYRSTYDILSDIADIWDELTDKNRANLLEALFGKRQAQIGAAILSNFDQARSAIVKMEESAGSAGREMDKITQSLDYKLNALKETWVGVAQNLFQTDDMKLVVDALNLVSNGIDQLTEKLGLFGTIGLVGAIALIYKFRAEMNMLQSTVLPVTEAIRASGVVMDGSATSVQYYATKLMGLDKSQRAAAMSALGLTAEQKKQVMTMTSLIASAQRYTIQELAEKAATDKTTAAALAKNMAKATEKRTTEQITAAMMTEILNSKKLTAAQKEAIVAALQQTAANEKQAFSWKVVGANAKAAFAAMATNPMTWITLAVTAVMALAQVWQSVKQRAEEARQSMTEAAEVANDQRNSLADLIAEYKELATAGDFDSSARETAKRIQKDITDLVGAQADNLDLVNGKLDDEIKKLDNIKLQAAYDARDTLDTKYRDAMSRYNQGINAEGSGTNFLGVVTDAGGIDQILRKIGYVNDAWENVNGQISISYALAGKNAEEVLAMYKELQHVLLSDDSWQSMADSWLGDSSQDVLNNVQQQIEFYQGLVDDYNSAQENFLKNEAVIDLGETLKTTDINTQDAFDGYIQGIKDSTEYSEAYKKILLELANDTFPEFSGAMQQATNNGGTSVYIAQLEKLTDVISGLQSSYDALASAESDMAGGGGLSAETIESLAGAEEKYLDYLYEENGVVKLNTAAWKENANAKMQGEMDEIQKEIDSLQERNATLQESIKYYEEQRNLGNDGGLWSGMIGNATEEIKKNNEAIAENQGKLAIYSSLYGSITGDLDAYTSALQNFSNVATTIDTISDSFQTLADLQAEVANGFTMSLDRALEFAKVYPEIMNNAQVAADGQIILNEGVVNSFIQGKKAELDAQIDGQIAQLEAEKAVLQAKMEAAQTQLDLAKAVAEGEGDISKELAEYRINAGNAVAQALIDAGVDEATAFKLAAAAMAQNAEEFNRVAAEVCTDVNGNFNQAAYDLAQTMYNNLTSVKTDLASVAKQAHQTAKAIAGVASGTVAGSADVQGGSGGGTGGSGIKLNLTSGSFKGAEYSYTAKESNLEDFISQIELDVSKYQDAISQIDGQIAALQALKNAPLKSFKSDTKSGSGSKKDVEEYVATIDDYREAVERLRKTQEARAELETKIDNSDDLREKILLERQLIGAYQREQEALQNLNDQRESTISSGAKALRDLGFEVQYNADTNELWIANMEHLNELVADSKGGYDTLQEATNGLRKETEDLINSLTDLNEENRDGSESWKELGQDIKEARKQIMELLDGIVEEASDAVDTIQNVYDTLHDAADEYAQSGFITVDTLQSIIGLGQKYVAYLIDENGQLVINEERIQAVIAARTQQMAIESSLAYVEALRMAKSEGDIATLNNLLYATEQATNATWGLVYANLALAGLDEDQYQAALRNINAIRAMADSAVQSIGKTVGGVTDELEEMQNGLNDILDYVMDMLKQRIQDQIDGLEDMKDAYSEIIDLKKQSLEASKDEADHQKTMASKMREIAKLQARIDMLSLDDSREAQAEKAALLKELSELQSDLADEQADRTLKAQEDALDKMEESYHDEKDKEIGILEDSISSHQKLYDMAISYIESHWDTLYSELISWNTQYGDVLNSDIANAWDNCLAAAQRYGSYVSALGNIGGDIKATQSSGTNFQVGNATYDNSSSGEDMIHAIIKEMYANSKQHAYEDAAGKLYLNRRNLELGSQLAQYGITAVRGNDGVWYVDRVGGQLLYDKYRKYTYHEGGIVGGGDIKSNEQLSLLKTKEWVLSEQMVDNLITQMDRINMLSDAMSDLPDYAGKSTLSDVMKQVGGSKTVNNITNNSRPIEVQIGDTIIHGADQSTVEKHIKVTRDMVNQIGRLIGIGR